MTPPPAADSSRRPTSSSDPTRAQLRITLVNQFYPPDLSPTAHLSSSLAEYLAGQGHQVTVLTGGDGYVSTARSGPRRPGQVRVIHLWTPTLGKSSIVKRLTDYLSFLVGSLVRLVTMRRQDVVVSLTTPPFVVITALAHKLVRRRARVVLWSMDCYPDVIERLGSRTDGPDAAAASVPERGIRPLVRRLRSLRRGGPLSSILRAVNRRAFQHLDQVVALDDAMAALLTDGYAAGPDRPPVAVLPNWESIDDFPDPLVATPTPWSGYDDAQLRDRFVVLYLGNLGYGHRVETVAEVAGEVAGSDLAWLFVGGGVRWGQLTRLASAHGASDVIVQRPYVPKALTGEVMAGAGCALIVLADEALGVMSPSKLHANLAAGLPILYVGPAGSNVDHAIDRFGCGVSIRTGDRAGLAAAVRRLQADEPWRQGLGHAARRAFEEAYSDAAVLPQWAALIDSVATTERTSPTGHSMRSRTSAK